MLRLRALFLAFAICGNLPASDELNQQLKRIFESETFSPKHFGPARWIEGGAGFTTVERAQGGEDAKEIIRYETVSGKRSVLISASQLTPKGGKPLSIEDYRWSSDSKKLLIFTNAKKVWRYRTRGDYWMLDMPSGTLKKLGGEASEAS